MGGRSRAVALGIFFRWRATWTSSWWRRGICGCLLAIAVSGMHWTAAVGTSYKEHDPSVEQGGQLSRSQTVIICAVLVRCLPSSSAASKLTRSCDKACVSCSVLSACAILAGGDRRRSRAKARQVVLSCAFFDPAGRVMVTPHAGLPSRKIVDRYRGKVRCQRIRTLNTLSYWTVQAMLTFLLLGRLLTTTILQERIQPSSGHSVQVETGNS